MTPPPLAASIIIVGVVWLLVIWALAHFLDWTFGSEW